MSTKVVIGKAKKGQHSNKKKEVERNASPYFDEYHDLFTFKVKPVPYSFLVRMAEEIKAFADEPTTLRVNDFYDQKGLDPKDYYRFKEKSPEMQLSHAYLMRKIASRRDIGALTRKFDAGWTEKNQPIYDKDFKDLVEWRASLTNKEGNKGGSTINVVMQRAEDTDVVPAKKDL